MVFFHEFTSVYEYQVLNLFGKVWKHLVYLPAGVKQIFRSLLLAVVVINMLFDTLWRERISFLLNTIT